MTTVEVLIIISNAIMILAVILGPIIAVQVEKYLERKRDIKDSKLEIFKTLMATRGKTLDPDHVEALNMIDLEFDGEKSVTDAWKAYLDHLINIPKYPTTEGKTKEKKENEKTLHNSQMVAWHNERENYLAELLYVMGQSLGYKFDKTHIKRSIYSPQGHADIENDLQFLRKASIELLMGRLPLRVETISPPFSDEELKTYTEEQAEQKLIRELLIKHYKGEEPINVKIIKEDEKRTPPVGIQRK